MVYGTGKPGGGAGAVGSQIQNYLFWGSLTAKIDSDATYYR